MLRIIIAVMLLCASLQVKAQPEDKPNILFNLVCPNDTNEIRLETVRCYISNLSLYSKGRLVYHDSVYHLLNLRRGVGIGFSYEEISSVLVDSAQFNIGVDSLMSVSGAMGDDLDPEKGMYWAWQSGYINFKIEGRCNKVPARNHEFQYHIGGYAGKDNALQTVGLHMLKGASVLSIDIRLDEFFSGIDISKQYSVMIPGPEAVQLAKRFAGCFKMAR
ncbi:MAG: hypothetical protein JST82_01920 [Bacteroidetes bacterium]|nr:hypothetical protein [Bacteroidota bacterium]